MKKLLLTIIALAMVAVGCGTPKVEVPKATESDAALLQAYSVIYVVDNSITDINNSSLLYLSDSFDINLVGKETTFNYFDLGLSTFPNNKSVSAFVDKYDAEINKGGFTFIQSAEMIHNKSKQLDETVVAVFLKSKKTFSTSQIEFIKYCEVETLMTIMNSKKFDEIARMNQGNEFEDINNNKAKLCRYFREYPLKYFDFDKVFKANIDVMIDDVKTKGNGVYYQKMYDMIAEYLDELRNKVKEGPFRDFVK